MMDTHTSPPRAQISRTMDCSFVAGEGEEEEELGILINDQHDGFM